MQTPFTEEIRLNMTKIVEQVASMYAGLAEARGSIGNAEQRLTNTKHRVLQDDQELFVQ